MRTLVEKFSYTMQPPTVGSVVRPEFLDHRGVTAMFSISRATCYRLAEAGRIRSVNLREPGKLKGRRLFCVQSIQALMEASIDQMASVAKTAPEAKSIPPESSESDGGGKALNCLKVSEVTQPSTPRN
jgi:hypothetical protein